MTLAGRSVVSIDDLSNAEIERIFDRADSIEKDPKGYFGRAAGRVVATLFYEPSTRTRLSFESAAQRLGGGVISTWDMQAASVAKGESLADTIRVVGGYSDAIVVRHPWEGASRLAAEYSPVPVINAGDGSHEHPTQTLCDLYTLRRKYGTLKGLKVALCGDLEHGRTVHSLAVALVRFQASVLFYPSGDKNIPDHLLRRLRRDFNVSVSEVSPGALGVVFGLPSKTVEDNDSPFVIYVTPTEPNQPALLPDIDINIKPFRIRPNEQVSFYVTRIQKERERITDGQTSISRAVRQEPITLQSLNRSRLKNVSIMHPLPRTDEISPDVDDDERSIYFEQSRLGVPVRMAILHELMGLELENIPIKINYERPIVGHEYTARSVRCRNKLCASANETKSSHSKFELVRDGSAHLLRCLYCDSDFPIQYVGNRKSKRLHDQSYLESPARELDNLAFFGSYEEAQADGFSLSPTQKQSRRKASDRLRELIAADAP